VQLDLIAASYVANEKMLNGRGTSARDRCVLPKPDQPRRRGGILSIRFVPAAVQRAEITTYDRSTTRWPRRGQPLHGRETWASFLGIQKLFGSLGLANRTTIALLGVVSNPERFPAKRPPTARDATAARSTENAYFNRCSDRGSIREAERSIISGYPKTTPHVFHGHVELFRVWASEWSSES